MRSVTLPGVRLSRARKTWTAVGVCVLAVALMYLAATRGIAALSHVWTSDDTRAGTLPIAVENAPPGIGTTDQHGPLGNVSMVFAGTEVEDGLVGDVERPWVAIGARTGEYRAIAAPDLPAARPHALAVSPEGDRLAWATGAGVQLYDTQEGRARLLPLAGAAWVGAFSPDGSLLTVHADGLRILDLASGEVVAEVDGTEPTAVRTAAWRPDGSAVDLVVGDDLVTVPADGSATSTQPSPFSVAAPLLWAPTGRQLVALQDAGGVPRLVAAIADAAGTVGQARTIDTSGIALAGLIGFTGEQTVAVRAYLLETGNIERILAVPLGGGAVDDITTLPPEGENWRGSSTLAVSSGALRAGATDFGNEVWPWSYRARLAACVLLGLFGLGLWATRTRRSRG